MTDASGLTTIASQDDPAGGGRAGGGPPVPRHIVIGARLQVSTAPTPSKQGIVRWIGTFKDKGLVGLEMVSIIYVVMWLWIVCASELCHAVTKPINLSHYTTGAEFSLRMTFRRGGVK